MQAHHCLFYMPFQKVIAWGFPQAIQILNMQQALINKYQCKSFIPYLAYFDNKTISLISLKLYLVRLYYFCVGTSNTYDLKSRHVNVCFSDGCYSDLGRQVNIVSKVYPKRVESAPKKLGKHTNVCAVKIL